LLKVAFHSGEVLEAGVASAGGGTGADPMAFPHAYHQALISDFLDAIRDGRDPANSGEEALKVHRFIDTLLASQPQRPK